MKSKGYSSTEFIFVNPEAKAMKKRKKEKININSTLLQDFDYGTTKRVVSGEQVDLRPPLKQNRKAIKLLEEYHE